MRLRRLDGTKKNPFYHVVVAEARVRTSKFIEKIGYYNPKLKMEAKAAPTSEKDRLEERAAKMVLEMDRVRYWKEKGAHPTEIVEKFIRMKDPTIYGAPIRYDAAPIDHKNYAAAVPEGKKNKKNK